MSKRLIRLQKKVRALPIDDQITLLMEACDGSVDINEIEEYIKHH